MTVRVDPRRLRLLKELAAAAGVRPGELVQQWVEERLDTERSGAPAAGEILDTLNATLASLSSRLEALAARVGALERPPAERPREAAPAEAAPAEAAEAAPAQAADAPDAPAAEAAAPRRRGRPRRSTASAPTASAAATAAAATGGARIPLHEEIIEVIRERGPMRAGELASAVSERGRYQAPRSSKPLDATTINSRVSNPVYRDRFVRREGKIGLADE